MSRSHEHTCRNEVMDVRVGNLHLVLLKHTSAHVFFLILSTSSCTYGLQMIDAPTVLVNPKDPCTQMGGSEN